MGNTLSKEIDYSKVRRTINQYYASLGKDVKVRIVHKKTPKGNVVVKFEGVEWAGSTSPTLITSFDISMCNVIKILNGTLEDGTRKIVSITDKAKIPKNCPVYVDGEIDKECITDKSFTATYQEQGSQYVK